MPSTIISPKKQKQSDVLQVAKLSENATIPTRGSATAAGYDLYSAEDCVIPARGKGLVKTDIQIKVPHGTYGRIAPRSGLAWKNHIDIGAGVVDEDYRGNVGNLLLLRLSVNAYSIFFLGVVMFNHADVEFVVKKGDRVAQLVCEKISYPEVEVLNSLDETLRGDCGFGSTGTN